MSDSTPSGGGRTPRKRGVERRREIVSVAAELFASEGFGVSTRAIAEAIGVTQAALYKHFTSKDALIDEVFAVRFLEDRTSGFADRLEHDVDRPFVERLGDAYVGFFDELSGTGLKLFLRAAWDGLDIATRYSPHLDERVLDPIVRQLRIEATLAEPSDPAVRAAERELALMLHSAIVFLAIRKFVYRIDFKGSESTLVRRYVRTWVAGALVSIRDFRDAPG